LAFALSISNVLNILSSRGMYQTAIKLNRRIDWSG